MKKTPVREREQTKDDLEARNVAVLLDWVRRRVRANARVCRRRQRQRQKTDEQQGKRAGSGAQVGVEGGTRSKFSNGMSCFKPFHALAHTAATHAKRTEKTLRKE